MNLKKELTTLKGETFPMSFPSADEVAEVKKEKGLESVLTSDLPKENVTNVLINCLANYVVTDRKEVFYVHALSKWLLLDADDTKKLPSKLHNFLVSKVLPASVVQKLKSKDEKGKEEEAGVYAAWIIGQVYEALDVPMLEEEKEDPEEVA